MLQHWLKFGNVQKHSKSGKCWISDWNIPTHKFMSLKFTFNQFWTLIIFFQFFQWIVSKRWEKFGSGTNDRKIWQWSNALLIFYSDTIIDWWCNLLPPVHPTQILEILDHSVPGECGLCIWFPFYVTTTVCELQIEGTVFNSLSDDMTDWKSRFGTISTYLCLNLQLIFSL